MQKRLFMLAMVWISATGITGCATPKARVFGEDMPTMKAIHDQKFHDVDKQVLEKPQRFVGDSSIEPNAGFQWLPNPTLTMHVFSHLTSSGQPVPGYSTFFRLYTQDHIAIPSEQGGWE